MAHAIYQVDAFTEAAFGGNPAAVCLLEAPAEPGWMQQVAVEMNLSETAFLYPSDNGYNLRWFTPAVEVDLCGHATLASAHVLYTEKIVDQSQVIQFSTKSGRLTVRSIDDWLEMDFPATAVTPCESPNGLEEALGLEANFTGKSRFDLLIEVENETTLKSIAPDFTRLKQVEARGVIVTSRSDSDRFDFVSRFFAPAFGIDEDPVTGSAHCALAPYWSAKLGKGELTAYQASVRGGTVKVKLVADRVLLSGQAITTMRGSLLV